MTGRFETEPVRWTGAKRRGRRLVARVRVHFILSFPRANAQGAGSCRVVCAPLKPREESLYLNFGFLQPLTFVPVHTFLSMSEAKNPDLDPVIASASSTDDLLLLSLPLRERTKA